MPPAIRRLVTGHREDGLAVIERDDEIERLDLTPEHATFAVSRVNRARLRCALAELVLLCFLTGDVVYERISIR